jgi:hypothetical protein
MQRLVDVEKRDVFMDELENRFKRLLETLKGESSEPDEWGISDHFFDKTDLKLAVGDMRSLLTEINKLR